MSQFRADLAHVDATIRLLLLLLVSPDVVEIRHVTRCGVAV